MLELVIQGGGHYRKGPSAAVVPDTLVDCKVCPLFYRSTGVYVYRTKLPFGAGNPTFPLRAPLFSSLTAYHPLIGVYSLPCSCRRMYDGSRSLRRNKINRSHVQWVGVLERGAVTVVRQAAEGYRRGGERRRQSAQAKKSQQGGLVARGSMRRRHFMWESSQYASCRNDGGVRASPSA